jgi:hypothetical protein
MPELLEENFVGLRRCAPRPAPSEFEAVVEKQIPPSPNPFHFEDSQVVLQASRIIAPLSPLNNLTCFYMQAEHKKYKIHRYFLVRESEFFEDLFILPQPEDTTSPEGSDDEHPIILPETPIAEIENLLRFFYFGYGSVPVDVFRQLIVDVSMHDDYNASLTDWIAILSISTRFIFEKVRQRAIKEITLLMDEIEPFELIRLAIKYDVEAWLKPAYCRIVKRNSLMTHAEALKVPFPMAIMLMRSREQYWKNSSPSKSGGFGAPVPMPVFMCGHGVPVRSHGTPGRGSPGPESIIIDSEVKFMELGSKESDPATAAT